MSEGPLRRWSKRKSAARDKAGRRGGRGAAAPRTVDEGTEPLAGAESALPPADPEADPDPADYGLPSIESLDKDSDFTGFLAAGVPKLLKQAALRKLWRSDPLLANLDGLNDYDEDFRAVQSVGSAIASNYRVGRGMLSEEELAAEEAEAAANATETDDQVAETDAAGTPDDAPPESEVDAETSSKA